MATAGVERERKFLVADVDAALALAGPGEHLVQGYLDQAGGESVRIRCWPDDGWAVLTVKGPREGMSRREAECDVTAEVAELLLSACGTRVVDKTRRHLAVGDAGVEWTLDVFHGRHDGLVLAEAELTADGATVVAPPGWCGPDVTDDERYYNEALARAAGVP
ncbi:MAG TPA: CYTH domain-containing protein [Acidimicrobiales bacterium]|nr:CYTH domain-containing protein [Acidimicrobiales bacterium]